VLQQSDNNVKGSLGDYQIQGTVSDNHLAARWDRTSGLETSILQLSNDCQSFGGNWPHGPLGYSSTSGWDGPITGKRVEVEV
jgi:hypothetical protein